VTTTDADLALAARFPHLFAAATWEWAASHVQFSTAIPDDALVTNVHVVCFAGDRIVLCEAGRGVWFLPGGGREPGEDVEQCVRRELREEAGASLAGPVRPIGAHYLTSYQDRPTRPGNPHPVRAILWCTADVVVDGEPTNPADGEQVVEVRAVPLGEARELAATDGAWSPEMIALGAELHRSSR
jgi:8-oxo-dGTP diphosphatase